MTCTFEYLANGGSSEEWVIEFAETNRGDIVCTIARPSPPSYLYFNHFQVSVTGGEIASSDIEGGNGLLEVDRDFSIDNNICMWVN